MNLKDSLLVLGAIEETPEGATEDSITDSIDIWPDYLSEILEECVINRFIREECFIVSGCGYLGCISKYWLTDEGRIYLGRNEEGGAA